ncbi:non-ribosomal peptide synthetase [Saccharothrix variisporea]|uniref:Amino acid adenylation domain-containing protein n=1 Tax=Saccharothrix variisporea TaxID=543527 RepID=A0A495XPP4_9PSEU|nr:non-ribosomal peptide synthetase [Saccharothrix variisporea]RKT74423.1 amino acid adenylation domain-containing protein [Saccharothrix variisporea]
MRPFALSAAQRRLWFAEQRPGTGATYVLPLVLRITGPLRTDALSEALSRLVARHDALRTRFGVDVGGQPVQWVSDDAGPDLRTEVVGGSAAEDELRRLVDAELSRDMDIATGPLFRALLVVRAEQEHVLVLTAHHLVADGAALEVVRRELFAHYDAVLDGTDVPPRSTADFRALVAAERTPEAVASAEAAVRFFAARLSDDGTDLPGDRPRPARPGHLAHTARATLPPDLAARLRKLAVVERTSPFTVCAAALHVLLSRYTGRADTTIGYMSANRQGLARRHLVAMVANTLPLRTRSAPGDSFRTLVTAVRDELAAAAPHRELRFEELVDSLAVHRSPVRHPVFQVVLNHRDEEPTLAAAGGALLVEPVPVDVHRTWLDLEYTCRPTADGGLALELRAADDILDRESAVDLVTAYATVLRAAATGPDLPIGQLPVLDAAGRSAVMRVARGPVVPRPDHQTLGSLLRERASRSPDRPAVTFRGRTTTYSGLLHRAEAVAAALRARDVGPGSLVGVHAARSTERIVDLVGIALTGAAYLPLDPDDPPRRTRYVLEDAAPALVVASGHVDGVLRGAGVPVVDRGALEGGAPEEGVVGATPPGSAGRLPAYVIYTSGSTGRPKGVVNTQAGIVNRLAWMQEHLRLTEADAVLHKTPLGFDVSVWEVFWPLVTGARLVVAEPGAHRDADRLARVMREESVSVVHFVPSMLRAFHASGGFAGQQALRHVVSSGEALPPDLRDDVLGAGRFELHNLYGPTEAAVDVTSFSCRGSRRDSHTVPIGTPVANTSVHVLDEHGRPVPFNVVGELHIGGVQVAAGYLNRPGLTAQRFTADPFGGPADRLYRTGDLGRVRRDGVVEFVGRADRQVKLRGFRVEPAEVEAVLRAAPGVREAAVRIVTRSNGSAALVAHLATGGDVLDLDVVRGAATAALPAHMVPVDYHVLDAFPLLPNGKVDHQALAAAFAPTRPTSAPTPPDSTGGLVLAAVREVLDDSSVGYDTSFFTAGGDSISSILLVAAARRRGLAFTVDDVFRHPTARALGRIAGARVVDDAPEPTPFSLLGGDRDRVPSDAVEALPASALLTGLVLESARDRGYRVYVTAVRVRADFDEDRFRFAVHAVSGRHPYLRSSLLLSGVERPVQVFRATAPDPVTVVAADGWDRDDITRWLDEEAVRPFDWAVPPLLRVTVHLLRSDEFLVTLAEPFLDGWSATTVLTDLLEAYAAVPAATPAEDFPQRGFIAAEQAAVADERHFDFWQRLLEDAPRVRVLPTVPRAGKAVHRKHPVPLPQPLSDALLDLAERTGTPLKSLLLAAHLRVVAALSGSTDVVTGLMTHARPETGAGATAVGLFLNTALVRLHLPGGTWRELVAAVREAEVAHLPHRAFPYTELVRRLGDAPTDVTFNYTHFHPYRRVGGHGVVELLERFANDQTYFPLTAQFRREPLSGAVALDLELWGPEHAASRLTGIARLYRRALVSLTEDFDRRYEAAREPVVAPSAPAHRPRLLHELFEQRAEQAGNAVALRYPDGVVHFGELRGAVSRLAERLRAAGVGPGEPVGVRLQRTPSLVVALLAVLSVGGVYTPLDPSHSGTRSAELVREAGCAVVLEPASHGAGPDAVVVTPTGHTPRSTGTTDPGSPESAAYLIFTSGSTGRPRGVLVPHRAVVNRLAWAWRVQPYEPGEVVAARTPIGFVDSVAELLGPLLAGTPVHLVPDDVHDPRSLVRSLRESGATRVTLVPALLTELLRLDVDLAAELPRLRHWTLSGEPLTTRSAHDLLARLPGAVVHNLYGSTEVAGDVTAHRVRGDESDVLIPIGTPIDGCTATVLDCWGHPAADEVVGELVVAGAGVGNGYLPDAVGADRFLTGPDGALVGYRTGDLVLRGSDGSLRYVGRADRQLKVNGVRLDQAEVESALRTAPEVADAVVERHDGDTALVAYLLVAAGAEPVPAALRALLRERLPAAVPVEFAVVERWPLRPSGKVDRAALRAEARPLAGRAPTARAPRSLVERELADLWRKRLGRDDVRVTDDFFAIGGHSLHAIMLAAEVRERTGLELAIDDIFDHPTLAEQAAVLELLLLAGAPPDAARAATTTHPELTRRNP